MNEFECLTVFLEVLVESGFEKIAASEELANVVDINLHWLCKLCVRFLNILHSFFDFSHQVKNLVFLALEEEFATDGWLLIKCVRVVVRVHDDTGLLV